MNKIKILILLSLYLFLQKSLFSSYQHRERMDFEILDIVQHHNMRVFELLGRFEEHRLTLDCQSFIHGFSLIEFDHAHYPSASLHFPLSERECYEAYQFINDSRQQNLPICLSMSPKYQEYLLYNSKDCFN